MSYCTLTTTAAVTTEWISTCI